MRHVVTVALVLLAIIHLLPLAGVAGNARLAALYGVQVTGPDLEILLRHRAVLFGLLGMFLLTAAWIPSLQVAALVAAAVSIGSFVALATSVGGYNPLIARIVRVDATAIGLIVVAVIALAASRRAA